MIQPRRHARRYPLEELSTAKEYGAPQVETVVEGKTWFKLPALEPSVDQPVVQRTIVADDAVKKGVTCTPIRPARAPQLASVFAFLPSNQPGAGAKACLPGSE